MNYILELHHITKEYSSDGVHTLAVNDVNFSVPEGSFIAIMGASGSGKTTLLNLISTIDRTASGDIFIAGKNISDISENEIARFRREHLGFIFQDYNLLDTLTLRENIALALTIQKVPRGEINTVVSSLADRLEIGDILQLMIAGRKNETITSTNSARRWSVCSAGSFALFFCLLMSIVFLPGDGGMMLLSVISLPLLFFIFSFYKAAFAFGNRYRQDHNQHLYQGNRLYMAGQIFSGVKTNVYLNTVLCICLLFSCITFVFGCLMLKPGINLMEYSRQRWMGFLQICMCIIFIVIYFSVLSVQQIIDLQKGARSMEILKYLGKTPNAVKKLTAALICVKFGIPFLPCAVLLITAVSFANYKAGLILSVPGFVAQSIAGFFACCLVMYLLFSCVV